MLFIKPKKRRKEKKINHSMTLQIIANALAQTFKRKILETLNIRKLKPTLKSQKDLKITHLTHLRF